MVAGSRNMARGHHRLVCWQVHSDRMAPVDRRAYRRLVRLGRLQGLARIHYNGGYPMNYRERQIDAAIAGQMGAADPKKQAEDDEYAREMKRREEEEKKRKKGDSRGYWMDMLRRLGG